jgi:GAF domain-containing protein
MTKQQTYETILPQIRSLVSGETDLTANMANASAVLHDAFDFWWVGFYLVRDEQLVLGPFQGPVACTRIPFNRGVCGTAWAKAETIVVPDVHLFPGHIACSSLSQSEIVVPLMRDNQVFAVLDIDSRDLNAFDDTDRHYLEQIAKFL